MPFRSRVLLIAALLLPAVARAQTEAVFDIGRYAFEGSVANAGSGQAGR